MTDLIQILVALVTGYMIWTVVTALWRYNAICRTVKNFNQIGPAHWFWGHMKLDVMSDLRSLLNLPDEEVYKRAHNTKWTITWMSFIPLIQANHPDSAKAVLKLPDPKPRGRGQVYSVFKEFLGEGLVTSNGKKWERNRKLLTPAFHFDVLRPYVRIYNEAADIVLEKFSRQMKETPKSIDITEVLNLATLDVILRCALSYEGNIQREKNHPYATAAHRIGLLIMKRMTAMDDFMQILVALVVGYVLWTLVTVLWRYNALCQTLKNFAQAGPAHWFWGHMKNDFMTDMRPLFNSPDAVLWQTTRNTKWTVFWMSFIPFIQANHPESAKAVLKLPDPKPRGRGQFYSVLNQFLGDGLVTSNGGKWQRNRKLLTPAFHFDVLRPYVRIYNEAADIVLEKFARQMKETPKSTDILDVLNLATLDVILRCALSYEGHVQRLKKHPYATAIQRIGQLHLKRLIYPWQYLSWRLYMMSADGKEYKKHLDYIHGFADDLIAKRKKELAEDPSLLEGKHKLDFLDILMTAKDDSGAGLTDKEIRDEVDTFMFAGHDTTFAALTWALYNLGKHPEEQDKVYREVCDVTGDRTYIEWDDLGKLQKLTLFIKENMRMYPPVMFTTKQLLKPLELDGVSFPAGTSLTVSFFNLHHNPDIYPDHTVFRPERFLPENSKDRDPYAFLSFSAGPRNCIGQNFSMNEQKVLLSRIIKRFKLVLDEDHEVIPVPESTYKPKTGIKIRFEERKSS